MANPRWIGATQRHGYKGAFELAVTVDHLFGLDATTGVVHDWMYERLRQANPWTLRGIVERLHEAADQGPRGR